MFAIILRPPAYAPASKSRRLSSGSIKNENSIVLRTELCIMPDGACADEERAVV